MNFFKGWAIPGPSVPANLNGVDVQAHETLDALCGHYKIFQLKKGHRFSTDDLLVAWYGTTCCPTATRVLDLGSGVGSVGMIAAWRFQGATFVTIEAQPESVMLARRSARYNGIESRYEIRQNDFRDPDALQDTEKFDLILGSPPYFPIGSGMEGDHSQKIACRFELRGDLFDYCTVASKHLNFGGIFACVFPIEPKGQRKRVLDAVRETELVIIRQRAIVLRLGEAPLLSVFAMTKKDFLPQNSYWNQGGSWVEPPLVIRQGDGTVHPEYQAIKLSIGFPP